MVVYNINYDSVNVTENMELNNSLKNMLNTESFTTIDKKHVNKDYVLHHLFNGLNKPSKESFNDSYSEYDLNELLYTALNTYNVPRDNLRGPMRALRSRNNRSINFARRRVLNRMYDRYNTVVNVNYVPKFRKNIKKKIDTYMRQLLPETEYEKFKENFRNTKVNITIIDISDDTIIISVDLMPLFIPTDFQNRSVARQITTDEQFENYDLSYQPDEEFEELNSDVLIDLNDFELGESITPDENREIDRIVNTQEVTENGPNLSEAQNIQLEEILNRLRIPTEGEPQDELEERFNRLRDNTPSEPVLQGSDIDRLSTSELERMPTSSSVREEFEDMNREAQNITTDSDLEREPEQLMNEGGGNTQSKMTLFDDLDSSSDDELPELSSDAESDNIDDVIIPQRQTQTVNRTNYLYDLRMDETISLLKSIKLNNGCDDVIRFCQVSKKVAHECKTIPEIRDNVYMPCLSETMIMTINSEYSSNTFYVFPEGIKINRRDFLEKEKELNGTIEEYLNENLECSDRLKKQLLLIIDESLKQIPYFINNTTNIPISFLIFMIISVKEILNTQETDTSIFDTYKRNVKNEAKPILEYQLVRFSKLEEMGVSKHEIYSCFIKYLELLLNYKMDDLRYFIYKQL